jgi:hypothetical protein
MKAEGLTDYLLESEMAKALVVAQPDFTATGLALAGRLTTAGFLERLRRL